MKQPDVLALTLDEAIVHCNEIGWDVKIIYTKAPGDQSQGRPRVLRFLQTSPGRGVLTVARE